MSNFQIYQRLISFFWNINKNGLVILFLVALAESMFAVLTIVGIAPFADYLTDPELLEVNDITAFLMNELDKLEIAPSIFIFGAIFVCLNILRTLLEILVKFVALRIKYQIIEAVNTDLANNMVRAKWQFIKTLSQGKIINTLTRETGILGDCAGLICLQMTYVTKFFVLISFPFLLFPNFILTFLTISIVLFLPYFFIQKLNYRLGKITTETSNVAIERLSDLIRSIKPLKAYQAEEKAIQKYRVVLRTHFATAVKSHILNYTILSGYQTLGVVALVTTTLIFNNMLISEMAVIVWAMVQTLPLIARILASNAGLITSFPSFEQAETINTEAKRNFDKPHGIKIKKIDGIEVNNVSYSVGDTCIINGASLVFKRGQLTALCGYSGSGKSTLAEMIFGFISPSTGEVLINGINMSELSHDSYRSRVAYCSQESLVMTGSVYDNLNFAKSNLSVFDATKALKFAEAGALINNSRGGMDAKTGNHGNNLSGGERQKISLAQAYVKNPDVFLFDETMASIDSVAENNLMKKIKKLSKDKIIIMITHNLTSLRHADNIFMFEEGRIVASGDYKTLKNTSKTFQRFIMSTTPNNISDDHVLD